MPETPHTDDAGDRADHEPDRLLIRSSTGRSSSRRGVGRMEQEQIEVRAGHLNCIQREVRSIDLSSTSACGSTDHEPRVAGGGRRQRDRLPAIPVLRACCSSSSVSPDSSGARSRPTRERQRRSHRRPRGADRGGQVAIQKLTLGRRAGRVGREGERRSVAEQGARLDDLSRSGDCHEVEGTDAAARRDRRADRRHRSERRRSSTGFTPSWASASSASRSSARSSCTRWHGLCSR